MSEDPMRTPIPHAHEHKMCGAKTRHGTPCKGWAMAPSGRCRMHGGLTPRGMAAGSFKTGRYSRSLPVALAAAYEEALAQGNITHLGDELALIETRTKSLLEQLQTAEPLPEVWFNLKAALAEFQAAESIGDPDAGRAALSTMADLIGKGSEQADIWDEALNLVERRRRVVDTETKREVQAHAMISAEQMLTLVGLLISVVRDAVQTYVTDTTIARAILGRIQDAADRQILGGGPPALSAASESLAGEVLEQ